MKRGPQATHKAREFEFPDESSARSIDAKSFGRIKLPQAVVARGSSPGSRRYYWLTGRSPAGYGSTQSHYVISIQCNEEQIGSPDDAIVTSLQDLPELGHYDTSELRPWRGVFSPPHKPKILFSEPIEIKVASLPRWKPQITIDRRTLDRADD